MRTECGKWLVIARVSYLSFFSSKLGPFQKITTPTSVDASSQFYDSASNLSSELPGSVSTHTETPSNSVISQIAINGANLPQNISKPQSYPEVMQPQLSVKEDLFPRQSSDSLIHMNQVQVKGSESSLQKPSTSMPLPSISSPSSQFSLPQNSAVSFVRAPSRTGSKPPSFSDLASHDVEFSALSPAPTTPVFATSPFSSSPGVISPSMPVEAVVGEKRKLKRVSKTSKEQTEVEKEEKKRRLALEQEKERQWKLLQQQRLREQQSHQQTSTIQQVMMMKEQMRKDNNKPGRKSQLVFAPEQNHAVDEIRSNVLPHVEPMALTQSATSKDTRMVNQLLEALPDSQNSKQGALGPSNTVTTPSNHANQTDFLKSTIQPSSHQSATQIVFPGGSMAGRDVTSTPFGFHSNRNQQGAELESLLQINDSDLIKVGVSRSLENDVGNVSTAVMENSMPTIYSSNELTQLQMSTDGKSEAAGKEEAANFANDPSTTGSVIQQQSMTVAFSMPGNSQSVIFSGENSNAEHKVAGSGDSQVSKAISGFLLDSHPSVVQPVPNESFDKEHNAGIGQQQQQQQQQALLFQQQQFMAAQQQYIQWQLQQRNPELFQSMTSPIQFSSYTDKDLPEVDSEEQHQERIRFLFRQRQMQKQQVVQIQQQFHQQQVYTPQQVVPGSTNRPQMDQTQHYFLQQLMQYQQQIPEALQQQFLIEYSRQMQQRSDVSQSALQYDKFLAELAQRYGCPIQQSNAQTVSVMQHGVSWPNTSSGTFHPTLQQIFAYSGIDEEKAKELTTQQLYQLQMQHTLMMQMAASNLYPAQSAAVKNQSPAAAVSRKASGSTGQAKKARDPKKASASDKTSKADTLRSPSIEDKAVDSNDDSQPMPPKALENVKLATDPQNAGALQSKAENSNPQNLVVGTSQGSTFLSSSEKGFDVPVSTTTGFVQSLAAVEKAASPKDASKVATVAGAEIKYENHVSLDGTVRQSDQTVQEISKNSSKDSSIVIATSSADIPSSNVSNITSSDKGAACADGTHCGTDSVTEDTPVSSVGDKFAAGSIDSMANLKEINSSSDGDTRSVEKPNSKCSDGIHCGTDSEGEDDEAKTKGGGLKVACTDGIHCGTDSEDEEGPRKVSATKAPCTDGIHCGTDSEDETENAKEKKVCTDGIHCGTDSESEGDTNAPKDNSSNKCDVVNDKDVSRNASKVCSDGIHCGTDSEGDESKSSDHLKEKDKVESLSLGNMNQPRPLVVVCRQDAVLSSPKVQITSASLPVAHSPKVSEVRPVSMSNHTLEVIQEGDVTQSTFDALETMSRNLKDSGQPMSSSDSSVVSTLPTTQLLAKSQALFPKQEIQTVASIARSDSNPSLKVESSSSSSSKLLTTSDTGILTMSTVTSHNIPLPSGSLAQSPAIQPQTLNMQSPRAASSMPHANKSFTPATTDPQAAETKAHAPGVSQGQPFSPKTVMQGSSLQQVELPGNPKQKQKVVGIPPTSPQYQQLFMHQHQLLIMQFQQYQYQLQAQYQQLSQQQMSPQQQFLLQQQYHQQMVLLQRQFVQQQVSFISG